MLKQRNDNLTKDEELELGVKIQRMKELKARVDAGYDNLTKDERREIYEGEDALEKLVGNYYNLARKIAHRHHKRTGTRYSIEDLLQDAISALVDAAYKYDPDKDCRLSTYAFYGITKRVSSTINYQRLVRMPENKMGEYHQIVKAQRAYEDSDKEEQDKYDNQLDYVYKNVELRKEEVDLILENMQPQVSLNADIYEGDGELMDLIEDDTTIDRVSAIGSLDGLATEIIDSLSQYERDLIAFEFGAFPASMSYSAFLEKYDMTDRKVTFATNKVIREMRKIAEKVGK